MTTEINCFISVSFQFYYNCATRLNTASRVLRYFASLNSMQQRLG